MTNNNVMIRGAFMNNFGTTKKTNRNMYNTYERCRAAEVIPGGMNLRKYDGKLYAIDPRSPLSVKDLVETLSPGVTLKTLARVASKLGLPFRDTKERMKAMICDSLKSRKIAEPVLLSSIRTSSANRSRTNARLNSLGNNGRSGGPPQIPEGGYEGEAPEGGSEGEAPEGGSAPGGSGGTQQSFKPHITLSRSNNSKNNANAMGKMRENAKLGGPSKEAALNQIRSELNTLSNKI
jgi:hypothetical protein